MCLWKLKIYYYFFLVLISYPTKNRGSKSKNVASWSIKKIQTQKKKFIQFSTKVATFSRSEESSKIIKTKLFYARSSMQEIFVNLLYTFLDIDVVYIYFIHTHIYIICKNLIVHPIVRLPHSQSGWCNICILVWKKIDFT